MSLLKIIIKYFHSHSNSVQAHSKERRFWSWDFTLRLYRIRPWCHIIDSLVCLQLHYISLAIQSSSAVHGLIAEIHLQCCFQRAHYASVIVGKRDLLSLISPMSSPLDVPCLYPPLDCALHFSYVSIVLSTPCILSVSDWWIYSIGARSWPATQLGDLRISTLPHSN